MPLKVISVLLDKVMVQYVRSAKIKYFLVNVSLFNNKLNNNVNYFMMIRFETSSTQKLF